MTVIGIMQGRLSAPENNSIQAFPRTFWRDEFPRAEAAGLSSIEWIHDRYGFDCNPILSEAGRNEICALAKRYNVAVRSVCADWFMENPLVQCTEQQRGERTDHLRSLLSQAREIGARRVVLPFVDNSSLSRPQDQQTARQVLFAVEADARAADVEIHLETDLGPADFAAFIAELPADLFKINYDTGNSASLGFKPDEEFSAYGARVGSVHIKDRIKGGSTVPLGTGSCDFAGVRNGLRDYRYSGDFILQAARGPLGEEVAWARQNLAYALSWLNG